MGYYYDDYYYDYIWSGAAAGALSIWIVIAAAISVLSIVALWKIYTKAGEEGWAALVPFYNNYILYKITWGNGWLFLLLLIPFANAVVSIITSVKLAKAFGKGGGFACGLIFLNTIFMMILAFSNDTYYIGPDGGSSPPPSGGYGGSGGAYQDPYRRDYNQYRQESSQNPNYHYQRNEPQGGVFCHVCGARLEEDAKFCAGCGRQL